MGFEYGRELIGSAASCCRPIYRIAACLLSWRARSREADARAAWPERFNELFAQVAGSFPNAKVRRHGRAYLLGLLSQQERKTSWQLAEFAGDASPDGLQRLLNSSPWDEDACRDAGGPVRGPRVRRSCTPA